MSTSKRRRAPCAITKMKRIKAMNGYTIMQAVTARDEDMYNCEVGCYNVYFSSDIRDYGLTNSYPEYENVDSLEVAEMHCMGNYARAREIVENRTTCATYEEIEEVEKKLDSGMSELEIEEEEEHAEEDEEETEENPDKWFDIETGETVTELDLWRDYKSNYTEEERETYTFGQYKNNCLTYNGGTLERI